MRAVVIGGVAMPTAPGHNERIEFSMPVGLQAAADSRQTSSSQCVVPIIIIKPVHYYYY